ncbi:MAG: DEAD/DEAH box helicase [Candidatus Peribacteria bacterium]|jgi:superfamily II DNA/RNA helicase|nr:DEAD/DEAH box helicase [Candidatus Peribacteria bacterium]
MFCGFLIVLIINFRKMFDEKIFEESDENGININLDETITFKDLGISDKMLKKIKEKNYQFPSPIQAQVIPLLLSGEKDII